MPDALYTTHIQFIGQHPHTAWWGTMHADIVDITEYITDTDKAQGGMLAGRTPYIFRPWAHRDREQLFPETLEENRIHTRYVMGSEDYEGKRSRRDDSLDFLCQAVHDP